MISNYERHRVELEPEKRKMVDINFGFWFSVAEWLACWTRSRAWVQIAAATLSGNSFRHPLCLCLPSSEISSTSSPLNGCGGNCRPGRK